MCLSCMVHRVLCCKRQSGDPDSFRNWVLRAWNKLESHATRGSLYLRALPSGLLNSSAQHTIGQQKSTGRELPESRWTWNIVHIYMYVYIPHIYHIILNYVLVCVSACVYVHMSTGACMQRPAVWNPLELELQAVMRHLTWMLEVKSRSSAGAAKCS